MYKSSVGIVDPFALQHAGLVEVHHALEGSLHAIAAAANAPLDQLVMQASAAGGFMQGHHGMEEHALFPGLRRHGKLRSTDVAFLDGCERGHRAIFVLCDRLLEETKSPHPRATEIVLVARELHGAFVKHIAEEEVGLAPERLRTLVDEAGLAAIGREVDEYRRQFSPR